MCGCLMLTPSLSKVEKSLTMPMAFLSFYVITYAVQICILFPVWENAYFVYINSGLMILTIMFWLLAQFSDPGFIDPPKGVDFLELMKLVDLVHLCPHCMVMRTPRSRHCATCNRCVERYDHHCPWVNNCVGQKNHGIFIAFLTFVTLNVVSVFTSLLIGILEWSDPSKEILKVNLRYELLPLTIHENR